MKTPSEYAQDAIAQLGSIDTVDATIKGLLFDVAELAAQKVMEDLRGRLNCMLDEECADVVIGGDPNQ